MFLSGLNNGVHLRLQPGRGSLALGNQWGDQPGGEQGKVRSVRCTRWGGCSFTGLGLSIHSAQFCRGIFGILYTYYNSKIVEHTKQSQPNLVVELLPHLEFFAGSLSFTNLPRSAPIGSSTAWLMVFLITLLTDDVQGGNSTLK